MSWPRLVKDARPPGTRWAGIKWRILGNAGLHVSKKKSTEREEDRELERQEAQSRRRTLGCRRML